VGKKSKKLRNPSRFQPTKHETGKGCELGQPPRVMSLADMEFNTALIESGVVGCAYGLQTIEDSHQPIPALTLICRERAAALRAYESFKRWGCEQDGDVVDVRILLKQDGTYQVWVSAEFERSMYRINPRYGMYEAMGVNVSWIKTLDTTSPMVRDLKGYVESELSPVAICASLWNGLDLTPANMVWLPEWKPIVKFNLKVIEESDIASDFMLGMTSAKGRKGKPPQPSPQDVCKRREGTVDRAFAVTRERVLRSDLVNTIKLLPNYSTVAPSQVVQAAINLQISNELHPGDAHYSRCKGDYFKAIWRAIEQRSEIADSTPLQEFSPPTLARQIELDVAVCLDVGKSRVDFKDLQRRMRDEGYVHD
jgi:hypothetical protein